MNIETLMEELRQKEIELQLSKDMLLETKLQHKKVISELDKTKKRLLSERDQYKQSSKDLKKQNKELKAKNDELLKELQEIKNLNVTDKKEGASQNKAVKEQDVARGQQKIDINYVKRLENELMESNEKILDLESVLEAHQLEIEEHKDELKILNDMLTNDGKQNIDTKCTPNKKKSKDAEGSEVIKMLELFINLRKSANDASNYINAVNNKKARSSFDEQLGKLKNENNALIKSSTVVKLTKRSFEALEKDLQRIREENNLKLKSLRKQAIDALTKGKTVYTQVMSNYPENFKTTIEEIIKELDELTKVNLDSLYKSEDLLQEEIIKKLENEKELLTMILSKENAI